MGYTVDMVGEGVIGNLKIVLVRLDFCGVDVCRLFAEGMGGMVVMVDA